MVTRSYREAGMGLFPDCIEFHEGQWRKAMGLSAGLWAVFIVVLAGLRRRENAPTAWVGN